MADRGLRTPLARARGLGSAKDGTHHFWVQRLTAVALIPLTIWFALSIASLASLALLGAISSKVGGAPVARATARVTLWGAFAMALTAAIGSLVGTAI